MTTTHTEHKSCSSCLDTGKIIYGSDTLGGRYETKCACQKHTPYHPHPVGLAKSYSPSQTLLHKRHLSCPRCGAVIDNPVQSCRGCGYDGYERGVYLFIDEISPVGEVFP
jgi:hypothetical protein